MINDKLEPEKGKAWKPSVTIAELTERAHDFEAVVGRLATDSSVSPEDKEALALGLSDVLYFVFVLAEHYGIELEEAFIQAVNDYMLRRVK